MDDLKLLEHWIGKYPQEDITASRAYYRGENIKINERSMNFITDGEIFEDFYKANEKIAKNDYRTIVDQLTGYLLGNQPVIEGVQENVFKTLPEKNMWEVGKKALKQCQIQKVAWVQPYIKEGKLKFAVHKHSENIIPIYVDTIDNELEKVIYHYNVDIVVDEEVESVMHAEVWDKENVTYYYNINDDGWELIDVKRTDNELSVNPVPHVTDIVEYSSGQKTVKKSNSWGRVPFIPLWFNEEEQTMLEVIGQSKIDALDFLLSDGCNNFLDLADAMYILEGYNGDVSEALINLKNKKIAAVGDGGGVKQLTNEIPMDSREKMINLVKQAIYSDGRGVDMDSLKGGSLTNVVIKAWFSALDLKADNVKSSVEELYGQLIEYAHIYTNKFNGTDIEDYTVIFDKSMIMNVDDSIKSSNESVGNISEFTRLANDPRVNDPGEEIERMNSEGVNTYEEIE